MSILVQDVQRWEMFVNVLSFVKLVNISYPLNFHAYDSHWSKCHLSDQTLRCSKQPKVNSTRRTTA